MHRIDTPNKSPDLFGAGKHGWRNGNKTLGINPTEFNAEMMNSIQEELAAIAEAAGLTLNPANNGQVLEAIQRMIDAQSGNYALDTGAANAYVVALSPAITAYTDGMVVRFKVVNANIGASTLNAGVGAVSLVNDVGGALANGDAPAGGIITAMYIASAAKFYITSLVPSQAMSQTAADARYAAITSAMPGLVRNLKINALGVNNYNCVITADKVVLEDGAGTYVGIENVNKTINANGTVGAPLSIMSARAASTWYYRWLWYNATLGLTATLDVSSTAPTAPTGYVAGDFKVLLPGACRTDASGGTYILQTMTRGIKTQYVVLAGSNVPALPILVSGVQGDIVTPIWAPIAVANFAPPTAGRITVVLAMHTTGGCMAAPNNSYGSCSSTTNPPPLVADTANQDFKMGEFSLESSNIYYASNLASSSLAAFAWEDNL